LTLTSKNPFHVDGGGTQTTVAGALREYIAEFARRFPGKDLIFKVRQGGLQNEEGLVPFLQSLNPSVAKLQRRNRFNHMLCVVRDCFQCGVKIRRSAKVGELVHYNGKKAKVVQVSPSFDAGMDSDLLQEVKLVMLEGGGDVWTFTPDLKRKFTGKPCASSANQAVNHQGQPDNRCFQRRVDERKGLPSNMAKLNFQSSVRQTRHMSKFYEFDLPKEWPTETIYTEDLMAFEFNGNKGLLSSSDKWSKLLKLLALPHDKEQIRAFLMPRVESHTSPDLKEKIYNFEEFCTSIEETSDAEGLLQSLRWYGVLDACKSR